MSTTRGVTEGIDEYFEQMQSQIGRQIGKEVEFMIDQRDVDVFAAVTENIDPMHNDSDWGASGPWGGTIVHGLYVLGMTYKFYKEAGIPIFTTQKMYSLNYGFNKVRFPAVFHTGEKGIASIRLLEITDKTPTNKLLRFELTVRQPGKERPSCVAEFLTMVVTSG